jgi:short-subunit dehydrogenase
MTLGSAEIVGAGPGLGLELARTFASAGHPVAMLARNKARLDTHAAEIASDGQGVQGFAADAAAPEGLRAALRRPDTHQPLEAP